MSEINDKWLAGFFDGEGSISLKIQPAGNSRGYQPCFRFQIAQSKIDKTNACEKIQEYLQETGIQNPRIETNNPERSNYPMETVVCTRKDDVKQILERIEPFVLVKEREVKITLNQLIPLFENRMHWNKPGFLKMIAIKEELDKHKSGKNSKYTVEYFENEWDMEYEKQKKILPGYSEYSN